MKLKSLLKKKLKKKIPFKKKPLLNKLAKTVEKSEYERICDKALYETIGSKGCLPSELYELLDGFDAETNPVTVEQAEQIIYALLQKAVAARAGMLDAFVETAKTGDTAKNYRQKINNIHNLISKEDVSSNEVDTVNNDYDEFKNSIREEKSETNKKA